MKRYIVIIALVSSTLLSISCRESTQQKSEEALEAVGNDIEAGLEDAGNAIENAADETGEALKNAAGEVEEEIEGTDDYNGDDDN